MAAETTTDHVVSVENYAHRIVCGCGFTVKTSLWGPTTGRRLAWAHVAKPEAPVEDLLAFLGMAL